MRTLVATFVLLSFVLVDSSPVHAAERLKKGFIVQMLMTSKGQFGGCMIKLDKTFGGVCTAWASLDCEVQYFLMLQPNLR